MQQRKLGQLGTPVSAVGYGAMSFTDFYGPATEEGSEAVLAQCINLGITHIDTSNAYGLGKSENRIGAFLTKQGKQAQDFFKIATNFWSRIQVFSSCDQKVVARNGRLSVEPGAQLEFHLKKLEFLISAKRKQI